MLDNKTRNDILLEEKIAKIDDINFDKIYDVDEFASKQLETFEDENAFEDSVTNKINDFDEDDFIQDAVAENNTSSFELELQPNEFLDNMVWGEDDEIEQISSKRKFSLCNKPLFYTFTSIALLLCILFIYNVFVIKSLESKVSLNAGGVPNASISVLQPVEENNNITFENSTILEITENANFLNNNSNNNSNSKNNLNTNWFNEVCTFLNKLFGGNY